MRVKPPFTDEQIKQKWPETLFGQLARILQEVLTAPSL